MKIKTITIRAAIIFGGVVAAGLLTKAILYMQMYIESVEALSRAFTP